MRDSVTEATKAFIFDYGGTLDTGGCHWGKVLWHAYEQEGVPVAEDRFRDAYVVAERKLGKEKIIQSDYTFYQTLAEKLRIELDELHRLSYHEKVLERVYQQVKFHTQQSREVLLRLKKRYPLALVSNFYGNISVVLKEFGFSGLFDAVIESATVGFRKPDPRIFMLGVEALGLSAKEVTVVGDSMEKDILPAKSAGCHTIWFRGEQWLDAPFDETVPDRIIDNIKELNKIYEAN